MSSFVEINGKKFQSVSDASTLTGYSRDYIGRLAREQKILATQIGRQWFVFVPSLKVYAQEAEREQKSRRQKLSQERKREREATKKVLEKERARVYASRRKKARSRILGVAVLTLGLGLGVALNSTLLLPSLLSQKQTASAPQAEVFSQTKEEYPIATGDSTELVPLGAIDFSQESMTISTLDGDGAGVLLLPNEQDKKFSEAEVKAMFSDPVSITTDEAGNRYVVRVTADGTKERLPFAVVPVTNSKTP